MANGLSYFHDGTDDVMLFDGKGQFNKGLNLSGSQTATDTLSIVNNSITTGSVLDIYSNSAGHTGTGGLINIHQDNASADGTLINVTHDGTGQLMDLESSSTTVTNGVIRFSNGAVYTGGDSTSFVNIQLTNSASTGMIMNLDDAGSGRTLNIDKNGQSGAAIYIDTEVNSGQPILIFDGAGTGAVTGGFYRLDAVSGCHYLKLGNGYLWVDATGDLRIHNDVPINDLSGAVVGGQS